MAAAPLRVSSDCCLAEAFREICPAGHGYTYSSSDIRLTMRKAEEAELARPSWEQGRRTNGTLPRPAERQPLRAATGTWLEARTVPDKGIWAGGTCPRDYPSPWVIAPQRATEFLFWILGISSLKGVWSSSTQPGQSALLA